MYDLALKMLFGDRAKYIMLICGLTFAALLMTEQASIFCGVMKWSGSTIDNVAAPIWVVDPAVEQVNDTDAMRDTDVNRVRSVDGVAWSAPLYSGILRARLADGSFKFVQLIGIDATTFAGARSVNPGFASLAVSDSSCFASLSSSAFAFAHSRH